MFGVFMEQSTEIVDELYKFGLLACMCEYLTMVFLFLLSLQTSLAVKLIVLPHL
jgi:hypothetical protein